MDSAAIMCPILPDPEFGMVQLTGRALTSKALYSCLRGFRIMGNQERECVIPGIWSGNQPVCSGIMVYYALNRISILLKYTCILASNNGIMK